MRKLAVKVSGFAGYAFGLVVSFIRTWVCFVMFKPVEVDGMVYRRKRIVVSIMIFPLWLSVTMVATTAIAFVAAYADVFVSSDYYVNPRKSIKDWTIKEQAAIMRYMTFGK